MYQTIIMKYIYQFLILTALTVFGSCTGSRYYTSDDGYQNYSGRQDEISYQQFYDDLSPYGSWMSYQGYGYVWRPGVPDFRPYYSNGHWVYTSYGWTWLSNYSWGWAPFHYGRWMNDRMYGWMWVPGYEWAPAWVSWRGGGDYYGWAPLGPQMGGNMSLGSIPYNDWAFVPSRHISSPRINNYYVNNSRNVTIINNTTIINNNTTVNNNNNNNNRYRGSYNPGPSVKEVEGVTRSRIREFNVVETNKPGATQITNNSIRVYRPAVKQESANSVNTKPAKVSNSNSFEGNRQNEGNLNNGSSAPTRVFPSDQKPQINRNENPLNNNPAAGEQRSSNDIINNRNSRTFPNSSQPQVNEQPKASNPATIQQRNSNDIINNRNSRTLPNSSQPQINNEQPKVNNPAISPQRNSNDIINNRNSRTFPNSSQPQINNEQPASRPPAVTSPLNNQRQNNPPQRPVREFKNPPSANINNSSNSQTNERGYSTHRETLPPAANNQKRELSNSQQQRPNGSGSSSIRYFNPAQRVETQPPAKQDSKQ